VYLKHTIFEHVRVLQSNKSYTNYLF